LSANLFRGAALKRVSSPEQLESAVRVTLPRHWLALAALLVVVAAGVTWSTVASVPTTVSGPGYYLPQEGLTDIESPVRGTVDSIAIGPGSQVIFGRTVLTVIPPPTAGELAGPVEVVADLTGVVTEVNVGLGSFVQPGDRLALVKGANRPTVVYAYAPVHKAGGLGVGVPAHVTFGGGIGGEFGYAEGTISDISPFAVSEERLRFVLNTDTLVRDVQALGPVNEIVVRLTPSNSTPSGLVWGSGTGPPGPLPPGLSADVEFVLGTHHPIDDVL
jgi:biotin carboxyl carrier protein